MLFHNLQIRSLIVRNCTWLIRNEVARPHIDVDHGALEALFSFLRTREKESPGY